MQEPELTGCVEIWNHEQSLILTDDLSRLRVQSPPLLRIFQSLTGISFSEEFVIQSQSFPVVDLRVFVSLQNPKHRLLVLRDSFYLLMRLCCEFLNLFVREFNQSLKHLIVNLTVFDIVSFIIRVSQLTAVLLELILVLIPGIVVGMHLELRLREDNLNPFFNEIVYLPPTVFDNRLYSVFPAESENFERRNESFNIWTTHHLVPVNANSF